MIKNIILDIGDVLAHFQWRELVAKYMRLTDEEFKILVDAMMTSGLWDEFDRSLMSDEEIVAKIIEKAPSIKDKIPEFFKHMDEIVEDYGYSCDWINELHAKGFKVYILSNYGKTAFEACQKNRLKFLPLVDGKVISYELKIVKPEKEIYETLLKKYDLKADECVFFDDRAVNIEGAEKVGIHGILFRSLDQAKADLEKAVKTFG
ncbi:MAG: HAD family phosphatase [Lachnospiraceae bacterium]|nr:HAD family phosphatase [Lachnospiraceae bacterium]